MAEMVLPGTHIEVRPEGLIVSGQLTVGNLGVVGTASRGPVDTPIILGSYTEARERFGDYDAWSDRGSGDTPGELTLVRALELAYGHGATTVFALRIASAAAASAGYALQSAGGDAVQLTASSPGTWGNELSVNVSAAEGNAFINAEEHVGGAAIALAHTPILDNARNRILLFTGGDGLNRALTIVVGAAPNAGEVALDLASGALTFAAGEDPTASDVITASYVVAASSAVKVTLRYQATEEVYTVVDGNDLVSDITSGSALVTASAGANVDELPSASPSASSFAIFSGGNNGAIVSAADYKRALDDHLLNSDVQIVVAAGQGEAHTDSNLNIGDELDSHCQVAASDLIRRDRIAVVGSAPGATLDQILAHSLDSDRVIFVAPGIKTTDAISGQEVTLPGAYAAAAVAGLLGGLSAHISPTNKTLRVGDLAVRYTGAQLTQLVKGRILALEARQGFRIVKGITTATNTAWHQITTRRIVDFAKFGVRSAANSFIGLLNNQRVRDALRTAINTFLTGMEEDEMLISYKLEVSATREEQRQGIARVSIVLRPVFSIDFIKVTMFLE